MSSPVGANDVLFGGGTPAAKFLHPGDTFAGPITALAANQARKFDKGRPTDELDFWPNGDPKMVAVVTLKTDHRDSDDPSDNGERKLYVASRDMQTKVRNAVKAAGKRSLDIGGYLSVTFTGEEKSESGLMAKVYEVTYHPASASAANAALGTTPQAAPQATIPTVQQTIPADAPNLENLPAEARALVERMLAGQQQS